MQIEQIKALELSRIPLAPDANVAIFGSGNGPGEHLQALLGRALTLAGSPACDARVRYHLARAAELTVGGGAEVNPIGREVTLETSTPGELFNSIRRALSRLLNTVRSIGQPEGQATAR